MTVTDPSWGDPLQYAGGPDRSCSTCMYCRQEKTSEIGACLCHVGTIRRHDGALILSDTESAAHRLRRAVRSRCSMASLGRWGAPLGATRRHPCEPLPGTSGSCRQQTRTATQPPGTSVARLSYH